MITDHNLGYYMESTGGSPGSPVDIIRRTPFIPDDPMDWAFGAIAVGAPYVVIGLSSGPAGVAAYSAAAPDTVMFAGGVAVSNIFQSLPYVEVSGEIDPIYGFYSHHYV